MRNEDGSKLNRDKQSYQSWGNWKKLIRACADKKPRNDGYVGKWSDEHQGKEGKAK